MGAGGNSSVGGRYTRFHWGTQQGGIQVDALSTSFEIQTQGIDCHFLSFALHNKSDIVLYRPNYSDAFYLPLIVLVVFCLLKNIPGDSLSIPLP